MTLTRLLNLWPPFDATQFIQGQVYPSRYHDLPGVKAGYYELAGLPEGDESVAGDRDGYHKIRGSD